jgi:hypothetical protein
MVWKSYKYEGTGIYKFSPLVFAGMIMLVVYLLPMILRPTDFV